MPLKYTTHLGTLERKKNDLALHVRRKTFDLFMRTCAPRPDDRVADFGVTGNDDHPVHYFFELLYPYKDRMTAIGWAAEDAHWYPDRFPGMQFVEADLRQIPLPDNYFAAGICNAVVEHGGNFDQQRAMVHEVCRVAERVLFTTPNKGFPVELHTFLPFVHWLPDAQFYGVLQRLGYRELASIDKLNPLDAREFLALFPANRDNRLLSVGVPLLQTNLVCISTRRG